MIWDKVHSKWENVHSIWDNVHIFETTFKYLRQHSHTWDIINIKKTKMILFLLCSLFILQSYHKLNHNIFLLNHHLCYSKSRESLIFTDPLYTFYLLACFSYLPKYSQSGLDQENKEANPKFLYHYHNKTSESRRTVYSLVINL